MKAEKRKTDKDSVKERFCDVMETMDNEDKKSYRKDHPSNRNE